MFQNRIQVPKSIITVVLSYLKTHICILIRSYRVPWIYGMIDNKSVDKYLLDLNFTSNPNKERAFYFLSFIYVWSNLSSTCHLWSRFYIQVFDIFWLHTLPVLHRWDHFSNDYMYYISSMVRHLSYLLTLSDKPVLQMPRRYHIIPDCNWRTRANVYNIRPPWHYCKRSNLMKWIWGTRNIIW